MERRVFRQSKASRVFTGVVALVVALAGLPLAVIVDWNSGLFPNFTTLFMCLFAVAVTCAALYARNRRIVVDERGIQLCNLLGRVIQDVPWEAVKLVQYVEGNLEDDPYLILRVNEVRLTFSLQDMEESELRKVFQDKVPDRLIWH